MFVGIGFVTLPLAVILYTRINKRRAEIMKRNGGVTGLSAKELHELGDKAPNFVYTL